MKLLINKHKIDLNYYGWVSPKWLRAFIIFLLILGIIFRFINIDKKPYSFSETITLSQIYGYTDTEITEVLNGQVITIQDLHKYQHPNSEKTLFNTIEGIGAKAQLTPLYFILARFWVQWFGDSTIRSLSATLSLLAFPCIYWLCLELFGSPLFGSPVTAWVAIALLAVSPFHLLYAQEAQPYSLWTAAILLSHAALLQAVRIQKKWSWGIYAATVSISLYSHLFSLLVVAGHCIYVLFVEPFYKGKTFRAYIIASSLGLLAFVPWLVAIHNFQFMREILTQHIPSRNFFSNVSLIFSDFNFTENSLLLSQILVAILTCYSVYFLYNYALKKTWLFIFIGIGIPALGVAGLNLSLAVNTSQYLIPCYLAIQLAIAYLLATQIACTSIQFQQQKLWKNAMLALVIVGVLSCADISSSAVWWHKADSNANYYLAQIINRADKPLLLSDASFTSVLSLSHALEPRVALELVGKSDIPKIPDGYSDVFLYAPSRVLRSGLEKEYRIERIDYSSYGLESVEQPSFWRLAQRSK